MSAPQPSAKTTAANNAAPGPPVATEACRHTLQAIDEGGEATGTWVVRHSRRKNQPPRRMVVCRECGRFYGWMADKK